MCMCGVEVVRSKVTSKKLTAFLFASIMILRPFDLNTWVTCCFIFYISFGMASRDIEKYTISN